MSSNLTPSKWTGVARWHAQVDFGEAIGVIGGVRKLHLFFMSLPYSDAFFIKAYPAETTEAFLDGHVSAFAFFGGIPQSILCDNTKLAVAKIYGDGTWPNTTNKRDNAQNRALTILAICSASSSLNCPAAIGRQSRICAHRRAGDNGR
jgi:hypothetical protein